MTDVEFTAWTEPAGTGYAADLSRALDLPLEATVARSRRQFDQLLADGLGTEHTWLFVVVDADGTDAGTLWLGPHPDRPAAAYVYDILIDEDRRGQGLGRAAMLLAEDVLRDAGYDTICLSVFGFNTGARALYDSIGYQPVVTTMHKPLGR